MLKQAAGAWRINVQCFMLDGQSNRRTSGEENR